MFSSTKFAHRHHAQRADLWLRRDVGMWFTRESLGGLLGSPESETEEIAYEWVVRGGKRWRPFLTAGIYHALCDGMRESFPLGLRQVATAVELLHKASLVHDDIEDGDALRYNNETLHETHGVAVALNVGDFLFGEGYRILSECDAQPEARLQMLQVALLGHRTLSIGQGAELCWARQPRPLLPADVLDLFRRKTSPAFEVALRLGALCANADEKLHFSLRLYSEALGIAYQIRDDLHDFGESQNADGVPEVRPTLLCSLLWEKVGEDCQEEIAAAWCTKGRKASDLCQLLDDFKAKDQAWDLLASFKGKAIRSLRLLGNGNASRFLRCTLDSILPGTPWACADCGKSDEPTSYRAPWLTK